MDLAQRFAKKASLQMLSKNFFMPQSRSRLRNWHDLPSFPGAASRHEIYIRNQNQENYERETFSGENFLCLLREKCPCPWFNSSIFFLYTEMHEEHCWMVEIDLIRE